MIILDLPDFTVGTPNQLSYATRIRQEYVQKLVDRGFEQNDIQKFLTVRCAAKWWIDNKSKFGVMDTVRHFKSVEKLIAVHGSIEQAATYIHNKDLADHKEYLDYVYNSTPIALLP
jgi:SOS response regulatory protein OraA/RecX